MMGAFENAFITLLNMSITASYAAFVVIIARLLLKKAPKTFSYALWSVVFFRLLCPFSFSSRFSLLGMIQPPQTGASPTQYIPQDIGLMRLPAVDTGLNSANASINALLPAATPLAGANPLQIWITLGTLIWLTGVAILFAYALFSYLRLRTQIGTATIAAGNIYETDLIKSPFVYGFIKPRIYLPLGLAGYEREYILRHERTHIRRFDYLIKPLAFIALTLHWFNPMMWLCFSLMTKDMEMSCDEQVIKSAPDSDITAYSSTLLTLAAQRKTPRPCPLAFGESSVKSRITNILNYKKPAFWIIAVSAALVAILAVALISNPPAGEKQAEYTGDISAYNVDALFTNKTPYVGNNSKVVALINALPLPPDVTRIAVSLQTAKKPYGITVKYKLEDDSAKIGEEQFLRNSLLLFALIDNVEQITHQGHWNNSLLSSTPFSYTYTCEDAERVVGGDIRQFAQNRESLTELVEIAGMLSAEPKKTAMKGMELYVWRKPELTGNNDIHYTLLPGTNRNKSVDEVFDLSAATTDIEDINRELAGFEYVDVLINHPVSIPKGEMSIIADRIKIKNGSVAVGTRWFDTNSAQ